MEGGRGGCFLHDPQAESEMSNKLVAVRKIKPCQPIMIRKQLRHMVPNNHIAATLYPTPKPKPRKNTFIFKIAGSDSTHTN